MASGFALEAMPRDRPLTPLALSAADRGQLQYLAQSMVQTHGLVQRARIVLACAEGLSNLTATGRERVSLPTVSKWCRRLAHGSPGGPVTRCIAHPPLRLDSIRWNASSASSSNKPSSAARHERAAADLSHPCVHPPPQCALKAVCMGGHSRVNRGKTGRLQQRNSEIPH